MIEKLTFADQRYEEINEKLMDPAVIGDQNQYKALMREYKQLTPIVERYREYRRIEAERDEAEELLHDGGLDRDLKEMAEEQLLTSKAKLEELTEEIRILLLPKDPNDDKNVIVEIRGGAGGEEAALFAGSLYRMYSMYAQAKGWKTEILSDNPTELGGY